MLAQEYHAEYTECRRIFLGGGSNLFFAPGLHIMSSSHAEYFSCLPYKAVNDLRHVLNIIVPADPNTSV